ncbi:MAG TPA: HAMP domain-containing sensor histidine kinase [Alphaproteobacteria bacterium]|jgi:two-component system cell cycle sensor histidine kinase PleC
MAGKRKGRKRAQANGHDALRRDPAGHGIARQDTARQDAIGPDALRSEVESLRADRDQALAASRAKTSFLATISHELRTPLNGILGFAEMIACEQLGAIAEKRYPAYARDIVTSARRLLHVVDDILDMARLESGRAEVFRDTFALSDIVDELLLLARERVPAEGPAVEVQVPADFPPLWTDRRYLRQILVNLLANALAFTPKEGRVTLTARRAGDDLEIAVTDTGVGMSPEEVKRAVTRFGQVEDAITRKHPGIGLGLPLAKSLTELLGGRLTIASMRGQGTTVALAFSADSMRERPFEWAKPPDRMAERARRFAEKQGAE